MGRRDSSPAMSTMPQRMLALVVLLSGPMLADPSQASRGVIETRHLIVSDATRSLSDARLRTLADQAQLSLDRILAFWSVDPATGQSGKIRVIFDAPRRRDYYTSIVDVGYKEFGRRMRAVRVFGAERAPQEMVHKLTQALFLREDKLIRNMIGVATEERLGNPLSFPACGFGSDAWVLALSRAKALIPLSELGPDHESWGMKIGADGFPTVFDRARQSAAYAEAGSFGSYLIQAYGIDKVKQLYELSGRKERPWQEVFGAGLTELEANWLKALQAVEKAEDKDVSTLSKLLEKSPDMACGMAQRLAAETP